MPRTPKTETAIPSPLSRFLGPLDAFRQSLGKAAAREADHGPDALFGHALYTAGGRTPVFMLQGLARIFRKLDLDDLNTADAELFDRLRLEAKIVEDVLGQIDYWWVVGQKAAAYKLPRPVLAWAAQRHVEACGVAATWLEAREWTPHRYLSEPEAFEPRADRFERRLRKLDWPSPKRLRKAWAEFLLSTLTDVDATVDALDLTRLEEGLHEARRQVRWISVYASALGGQLVLDADAPAPPGWEVYLTPETVGNPFNRLPEPGDDDRPLHMPAPLFYALSHLIDRLGRLKDQAQWTHILAQGLEDTGSAKGRSIESFLGDAAMTPEAAAGGAAQLVRDVLRRDRLLARMAEVVEAQR
jgi:hypothetical protein